ncbi:MAG: hypothetical protein MRY57_03960 [Candidatus Pacebacteria bacterium]|nr:hypothetical protein [Candidatus Paceibacterota bacterium]
MKLTNQQIQSAIAELPDNIRKAVVTFDWGTELLNIGHEHGLYMDQIDAFRNESLMIILGKKSSTNYVNALKQELNIKKPLAEELVEAANNRIFHELQKRAFSKDLEITSQAQSGSSNNSDPYLEEIGHDDLRGPMAEEGIHLIDEEESKPQNPLQAEIDELTSGLNEQESQEYDVDPQKEHDGKLHFDPFSHDKAPVVELPKTDKEILETTESNNNPEVKISSDIENDVLKSAEIFNQNTTSTLGENNYQEPLDESDFKGISGHRTKTEILKTQDHVHPDHAFSNTNLHSKGGRDLGQGILDQSLEKKLMENPHIARNNTLDVSPTEQEQIKEEGDFLKALKKES